MKRARPDLEWTWCEACGEHVREVSGQKHQHERKQPMPRQQSIPGTDVDNPVIADLIERWLDACERAKQAAEDKATRDDAIVLKMVELGVPYHPYTDPESGKRKYRVVDTTPRGKSISARPLPVEGTVADEPEVSESTPPVQTTTHRKVSRAKAERDIAAARPVKAKKRDPNAEAVDGALRPARDWDADDADVSA